MTEYVESLSDLIRFGASNLPSTLHKKREQNFSVLFPLKFYLRFLLFIEVTTFLRIQYHLCLIG